jgi:isopenicillin N synthase-like dioxygenase
VWPDLNFLTIHGKSRFPGLFIWLRDGRRVSVVVPDGCLLIQVRPPEAGELSLSPGARVTGPQAGKQLEWLTGGHIKAGMHEVMHTHATADATEAAQRAGRSTWRVSSTLFAHIASDRILQPLGRFAEEKTASQYPATPAGAYVESELRVIKLQADAP